MPKRYAAHREWGGVFEISEDERFFTCLVEPTHESWTNSETYIARDWLACQKVSMGKSFTRTEFPITSAITAFEFNGKTYINMGAGELGFKKIRCVDNVDVYVRPIE